MSLVHEALQKAEKEKHRHASPAPVAMPQPFPKPMSTPGPATSAQPARSYQPVLLALTGCVALVAIVAIVWMLTARGKEIVLQTERIIEKESVPAATPNPDRPAADPAESAYKLSGIVVMPDGVYTAVINGRTVYETHFVDGAIVKKIERDRVTLDLAGRDLVLRLY